MKEYNSMVVKAAEEKCSPTFKEVVERLFDHNLHLAYSESIEQVPPSINSTLEVMLTNLDGFLNAKQVK